MQFKLTTGAADVLRRHLADDLADFKHDAAKEPDLGWDTLIEAGEHMLASIERGSTQDRFTDHEHASIERVLTVLDQETLSLEGDVVGYMWRDLAIELREAVEERAGAAILLDVPEGAFNYLGEVDAGLLAQLMLGSPGHRAEFGAVLDALDVIGFDA